MSGQLGNLLARWIADFRRQSSTASHRRRMLSERFELRDQHFVP
jgi:hypothetical protein